MTKNNNIEVFSVPCGSENTVDLVKYADFQELQEKIKFLESVAKDAFFAGFKLSKFFPSDSDISPKWDEYRDALNLKAGL